MKDFKQLDPSEELPDIPQDFELDLPTICHESKETDVIIPKKVMLEICKTLYHYAENVPAESADYDAACQLEEVSNYRMGIDWEECNDNPVEILTFEGGLSEETKDYLHSYSQAVAEVVGVSGVDIGKKENDISGYTVARQQHGEITYTGIDIGKKGSDVSVYTIARRQGAEVTYKREFNYIEIKEDNKCDCGAEKVGTTHSKWCSKENYGF